VNVRPATRADFTAIAKLFGAADEAASGSPSRLNADVVEGWLHTVALETNTWLLEEDGVFVAGAFAQLFGDTGNAAGAVHPSARGRGLGTGLLDRMEGRMTEEGARRLHSWTVTGDTAADALFAARGFREVRRFWDMAIELDADPPEPATVIETFREEEAEAFHAANQEAFSEHWEHKPEPFDKWWERQRRRSTYDPTLWFVVRDGDEIAAICRNESHEDGGYVGSIGVRPAWRGKGYGRDLLLHSFRAFRHRGHTRASLGVDAANATGATQLYESVGMHVELENVVWEKMLA